jgi:formate hydrogenlyase subunit 6/NADH:ubiquinone oxidoreductase subunit I
MAATSPPGVGLLKGLGVTLKHMLKPAVTQQYPHVKPDLAPRTRGVIALMDENCTVCMLCSRECPDWCIYIDSHKETVPPAKEGGRARTRNVLDRFAIDFALCMYCGICVEVCPFDALFWSPEFEYSEYDMGKLLHEKDKLREWMDTVPPPPPLDEGAVAPAEVAEAIEKKEKELEAAAAKAAEEARAKEQPAEGGGSGGAGGAAAAGRARGQGRRDRPGDLRRADRRGQVRAHRPLQGQGRLRQEGEGPAEGRGRGVPRAGDAAAGRLSPRSRPARSTRRPSTR